MRAGLLDAEHLAFTEIVQANIARHVTPNYAAWEARGMVAREFWTEFGRAGLLGIGVPQEYGGTGVRDFRFNAILDEQFAYAGALSLSSTVGVHNDVVGPYLLDLTNDEQKRRWLPGYCDGSKVAALALTESEAGSDLRAVRTSARRDSSGWVLTGTKLFITNGMHADLVVVLARTAGDQSYGLFVVETDAPGFSRGQHMLKIGLKAQDTAELVFDEVRLTDRHVLGDPSRAMRYLRDNLPQERLSIAVTAIAGAEASLAMAVAHCRDRKVFGQRLADAQHVRFRLAELRSEVVIGRTFVDECISRLNANELDMQTAAIAKSWTSELQSRVADACLQLFGGSGYMAESAIGRAWVDARVQQIYGGANEIMKEIIARDLLDRPCGRPPQGAGNG